MGWDVVGVGRKVQEGGDIGGLGVMKYKLSFMSSMQVRIGIV